MALPIITAKDLHTVQLAPTLRKILARRARQANRREYAPVLAADRAAFGVARQTYQREARGVRAATNMVENTLTNALAGLRDSGLRGGYLKQAIHELTSRQGDAAASAPFLLADARENRAAALSDAAQQLRTDRAAMLQGSAADFNQLLKEARTAGSSQLEQQEDRARSERNKHRFDPVNIENAQLALQTALSKWSENPTVKVGNEEKTLKEVNPLRAPEDWQRFAAEVERSSTASALPKSITSFSGSLPNGRRSCMHWHPA